MQNKIKEYQTVVKINNLRFMIDKQKKESRNKTIKCPEDFYMFFE